MECVDGEIHTTNFLDGAVRCSPRGNSENWHIILLLFVLLYCRYGSFA